MYEKGQQIEYFSGQGRMLMQKIDPITGALGKAFPVSNVPALSISFDVSTVKRKESMTGQRLTSLEMVTETNGSLEATLESLSSDNLQMVLFGKVVVVPAGNFTMEVPDGQVDGDYIFLSHPKVKNLVITDSASTPATLTEGDHYELDAQHGTIELKDVSGFTQPFQVAADNASYQPLTLMTDIGGEYAVRFQGLNTVNKEDVLVEIYRFKPNPTDVLNLISDEPTEMKLSGSILADLTKAGDEKLGSMGRIIKLGAKTTP